MFHLLPQSLIEDSESLLLEKKDHLIRRLRNLTDEQKEEVIAFFRKKPNLENKIDWNRKDLTYDDFLEIMDISRIIAKRRVVKAQGIRGLKEGDDYIALEAPEGVDAYLPLSWESSKKIACKDVGSGVGEWCTAYTKNDYYWIKYSSDNNVMIYILYSDTKEAIRFDRYSKTIEEIRDKENDEIPETEVHRIILRRNMREIMNADIQYDKTPDWLRIANTRDAVYEIDDDGNVIWKSGTWKSGTWEDGIWEDGLWVLGLWEYGIWEDGIWEDGTWQGGVWKGGTWIIGTIFSERFDAYIHKSKDNPSRFYEIEDIADSLEELEAKVQS